MKISGRRLNYRRTHEGACYTRVKKGLKKTVTRLARRSLNRSTRDID